MMDHRPLKGLHRDSVLVCFCDRMPNIQLPIQVEDPMTADHAQRATHGSILTRA